jgi:hypothetical protein
VREIATEVTTAKQWRESRGMGGSEGGSMGGCEGAGARSEVWVAAVAVVRAVDEIGEVGEEGGEDAEGGDEHGGKGGCGVRREDGHGRVVCRGGGWCDGRCDGDGRVQRGDGRRDGEGRVWRGDGRRVEAA